MTRGTWQGSGTWEVTGVGPGAGAVAVIAAAAALAAVLATLFWVLVAIGVILLAVIALLVIAIRRRVAAGSGAFTLQAEVIREATGGRAQVTGPARSAPIEIHYHGGTHLHVEPGADAHAILRQSGR